MEVVANKTIEEKETTETKKDKIVVEEVYTQVKDGNTEYIIISNGKTYVRSGTFCQR